jgi:hypothetical protein
MTPPFPRVSGITNDGSNIFVRTNNDGIKISPDSGDNWSPYNSGLIDSNVSEIYATPSRIFAGGWGFSGGVWFRDDIISGISIAPPDENELIIYPNPFDNVVNISFDLKKSAPVSIEIYNSSGLKVNTVLENRITEKETIRWETDQSGIYFMRITSGEFTSVRKIVKY